MLFPSLIALRNRCVPRYQIQIGSSESMETKDMFIMPGARYDFNEEYLILKWSKNNISGQAPYGTCWSVTIIVCGSDMLPRADVPCLAETRDCNSQSFKAYSQHEILENHIWRSLLAAGSLSTIFMIYYIECYIRLYFQPSMSINRYRWDILDGKADICVFRLRRCLAFETLRYVGE